MSLLQAAKQALEDCVEKFYAMKSTGVIDILPQQAVKAAATIQAIAQAEQQEPVAWFVQYKDRHEFVFGGKPQFIVDGFVEPLYTAPPQQREWVEPSDEQIAKAVGDEIDGVYLADFRAVLKLAKELNHV